MTSNVQVPRLKNMVEMVLEANEKVQVQGRGGIEPRNSDIALTIAIWQKWYSVGTNPDSVIHLYRLFDLPREDNVKRVRAVLQNVEGKYLPTSWEVARKRGIEREKWEEALGYKLDAETRARHYQTVAEQKPPAHIEEELSAKTQTYKAEYIGRDYGGKFKTGEIYELTMQRMRVGEPIIVVAPQGQTFRDVQAFSKVWKIRGDL